MANTNNKKQFLKDILTKGVTTKAALLKQIDKEKQFDPMNQQWFTFRYGKYYEFNLRNLQPQEGETEEQAEDRCYASLPTYTEEHIAALKAKRVNTFIITTHHWAKDEKADQ